jgi:hypothetical protein
LEQFLLANLKTVENRENLGKKKPELPKRSGPGGVHSGPDKSIKIDMAQNR